MKVIIWTGWVENEKKIHGWLVIFLIVQQDSLKLVIKWVGSVEYAAGAKHNARRRDRGRK